MTTLRPIPDVPDLASEPAAVEIRWPCVVSRWKDRMDLYRLAEGAGNGDGAGRHRAHLRADLVVRVERAGTSRVWIESWLEFAGRAVKVLGRRRGSSRAMHEGRWSHLDVWLDGRRVLALSMAEEGQPGYARSELLAGAGLTPGSCGSPRVERVDPPAGRTHPPRAPGTLLS